MHPAKQRHDATPGPIEWAIEHADLVRWMTPAPALTPVGTPRPAELALFRVSEIFAGEAADYRRALANVYAAFDVALQAALVYLVEGGPQGVALYFGVMAPNADLREARKLLVSALEGQLPGLALKEEDALQARKRLDAALGAKQRGLMLGVPAVDTDEGGELDAQGIERLVRALLVSPDGRSGERWRLLIVADPLPRDTVLGLLKQALSLTSFVAAGARTNLQWQSHHGTQTSRGENTSDSLASTTGTSEQTAWNKGTSNTEQRTKGEVGSESTSHTSSSGSSSSSSSTSKGKQISNQTSTSTATSESEQHTRSTNQGKSATVTRGTSESRSESSGSQVSASAEYVDKALEQLRTHLEEWLLPRFEKGYARGLLATRVLLAADTPSAYRRLVSVVRATFQGEKAALSPLEILPLPGEASLGPWLDNLEQTMPDWRRLVHSRASTRPGGTLLTPDELALIAGLPQRELPGIARRPSADFALSVATEPAADGVCLGPLMDHGRKLTDMKLWLSRHDFNKHIFVCGVTGAGKTTTCRSLLIGAQLPFMVIEPAKTEYRQLIARFPELRLYRPLASPHQALRINPLALVHPGQRLASHIEFLSATLAAVFPMEASMPYLVKQAIVRAYEQRGWSVPDSEWYGGDDPFDPAAQAWPTLSEMIAQLDDVIAAQKMGREFEEKYRGSLVSRLNDLTRGPLGLILNTRQSLDWQALLDAKAVFELEEIKSGEGKALLMALLLGAFAEAVKARHRRDPGFRHLTLVEEAHRLLAQPDPGADDSRRLAVEMFADLLAEVRKYGAGLIIVDQIPAKLIPDVLKNTFIKIAHTLFAPDDRRTLGESMLMSDAQRDYLPRLAPGEAVVFRGGWHMPALVHIQPTVGDDAEIDATRLEARDRELLWQERQRYFPTLMRVGYPDTADEAAADPAASIAQWADFVRAARAALTALLTLTPMLLHGGSLRESGLRQRAARMLQGFVQRWRPSEDQETRWRARRASETALRAAPERLLAAAWLACACDLVPLPRVEKQSLPPLQLELTSENWSSFFAAVTARLEAGTAPDTWQPSDAAWGSALPAVRDCLGALANYETF